MKNGGTSISNDQIVLTLSDSDDEICEVDVKPVLVQPESSKSAVSISATYIRFLLELLGCRLSDSPEGFLER